MARSGQSTKGEVRKVPTGGIPFRTPPKRTAGLVFRNSRWRRTTGNISPAILNPCR